MAAPRSNRHRFDDADWQPDEHPPPTRRPRHVTSRDHERPEPNPDPYHLIPPDQVNWSTYRESRRGPDPVPGWLVTDPAAVDTDLGVVKTGKEAELSLLRRELVPGLQRPGSSSHPGVLLRDSSLEPDSRAGAPDSCLIAVKRYRTAEHRLFHRDAGYLEGRRVRKSREMRAMRTRTKFGRELITDQWATAEFSMLVNLWQAGVPVPYPVQLLGTELMMEFIGSPDGIAAPRLAETRPDLPTARGWYEQLVAAVAMLAEHGVAHGDLSAYNVLVDADRLVLIDLPQAVDVVANPQGFEYLRRDCVNVTAWFRARGVRADPDALYATLTRAIGR